MNTYVFIGWQEPPLEAIPTGCWAEGQYSHRVWGNFLYRW